MADTDSTGRDSTQASGTRILDDNGTLISDAAADSAPPAYVDKGEPVADDDSGSGGLSGTDAGSPGGMGGARASGGTGNGNPPGGISPLQIEQETTGTPDDDS